MSRQEGDGDDFSQEGDGDDFLSAYELGVVASSKSGREANIVNVTTRCSLVLNPNVPVSLDLQKMAEFGRGIGLTGPFTDGVPSLSLTCQKLPFFGPSKVFIYQKGRVTQTGYNSEDQALLCAHTCADFLSQFFRTQLRVSNFRVFNIVAISHTGRTIDLDLLSDLLGPLCTYENPQTARRLYGEREHSGAIVKSKIAPRKFQTGEKAKKRSPCMVVFTTGVTVLMGAQNRDELALMMDEFDEHLALLDSQFALTTYKGHQNYAPKFKTIHDTIDAAQNLLEFYHQ